METIKLDSRVQSLGDCLNFGIVKGERGTGQGLKGRCERIMLWLEGRLCSQTVWVQTPNFATYYVCEFGQVSYPHCTSVSSSIKLI